MCFFRFFFFFAFEFDHLKEQPYWISLYPWRTEKGLARDVFDTFGSHSGLVHDVTDADCRAQNGVYPVFCCCVCVFLCVVLLRPSHVVYLWNGKRNRAVWVFLILFLSLGPVTPRLFRSPLNTWARSRGRPRQLHKDSQWDVSGLTEDWGRGLPEIRQWEHGSEWAGMTRWKRYDTRKHHRGPSSVKTNIGTASKATLGKTSERPGGAHVGFSERINTILNWTEQRSSLTLHASLSGTVPQTLPENNGYATEGARLLSGHLSSVAVSARPLEWFGN